MDFMIYARGNDDNAIEMQIKACQAGVRENDGGDVPDDRIFVDRPVPSENKKRCLLTGLMVMIRGITIDTVVCSDYTRIARDRKELGDIQATCRKGGVPLVAVGQCQA